MAAAPFVPPLWEAARANQWAQIEQAQRSIALDVAPPPVGDPFVPPDFQNPKGKAQGQGLEPQNFLPLTYVAPAPDTSTAWRVGVFSRPQARQVAQTLDPQNRLPLTGATVAPYYPSDTQWNNPVVRAHQPLQWTAQNLLPLGIPDAPVVVATDTEWLVRARRRGHR